MKSFKWDIVGNSGDTPYSCHLCPRVFKRGQVVVSFQGSVLGELDATFWVSAHKRCFVNCLDNAPDDDVDEIIKGYRETGSPV